VSISWNTGSAAERFRARAQRDAAQFNLKLKLKNKKKKRAPSAKLQAASPRMATIKKDNKI
jgi:hypothetical protein